MRKGTPVYAEHVFDLFSEIVRELITMQALKKAGQDITPSLAQGLEFIFRHGVCSVSDIAEGLSVSYSAASQLVDRLVSRGFVTRSENKRDRRLSEIQLTKDGQELIEQIRRNRVESMSRILYRMDAGSRNTLVEHLEKFIVAAIEDAKCALETCTHCGKDHISECVINELYQAATGMQIKET
ncbi:MAG: MarR family winged helix-turn-helix transcriptional regulator [Armatimonadota bacterium]